MVSQFTILGSPPTVIRDKPKASRRKRVQFRGDDDGLCLASEDAKSPPATRRFDNESLILSNEKEAGMAPLNMPHGETVSSAMQKVYVAVYGDSSEKEVVPPASTAQSDRPRESVVELPARHHKHSEDSRLDDEKNPRHSHYGFENHMCCCREHLQLFQDEESDSDNPPYPYSPGESFRGRRRGYFNIMGSYENYTDSTSERAIDTVNMKAFYTPSKSATLTRRQQETSWDREKILVNEDYDTTRTTAPRYFESDRPHSPTHDLHACDKQTYTYTFDDANMLSRKLATMELCKGHERDGQRDKVSRRRISAIDESIPVAADLSLDKKRIGSKERRSSNYRSHSKDSYEMERATHRKSKKLRDRSRDSSASRNARNRSSRHSHSNWDSSPNQESKQDSVVSSEFSSSSKNRRKGSRHSYGSWDSSPKIVVKDHRGSSKYQDHSRDRVSVLSNDISGRKKRNSASVFSNKADIMHVNGKLVAIRKPMALFGYRLPIG